MSYKALYRVFRPKYFSEVVGQDSIIKILQNQIINNQISHAYLFTGSRGTGKTSVAKIFARAVSCSNSNNGNPCGECKLCKDSVNDTSVDIIEIDAASNNGVDEIRDLRDKVKFAPVSGKYKVYIIDEVHMLSSGAFNALLKTLEEPPEHAIFILATTEPHKLPDTIISRCQRYDFNRIPTEIIVKQLQKICDIKKVNAEKEALTLLASYSEGGLRDAISLLDQCIVFGNNKIEEQSVRNLLGISSQSEMFKLADSLLNYDGSAAILQIETKAKQGKDISILANDIISHFRQLMVYKTCESPLEILSPHYEQDYRRQSGEFSMQRILEVIDKVSRAQLDMRYATIPIIFLELAIMKLCVQEENVSSLNMARKMPAGSSLQNNVSSGNQVNGGNLVANSIDHSSAVSPAASKKDLGTATHENKNSNVPSSSADNSENVPPWEDGPSSNSGSVNSGSVNSGSVNSGSVNSGSLNSGSVNSGSVNSGSVNSGSVNSGSVNSGSVNSGSVNSGSVNSGSVNSGSVNSGSVNSGSVNSNSASQQAQGLQSHTNQGELDNKDSAVPIADGFINSDGNDSQVNNSNDVPPWEDAGANNSNSQNSSNEAPSNGASLNSTTDSLSPTSSIQNQGGFVENSIDHSSAVSPAAATKKDLEIATHENNISDVSDSSAANAGNVSSSANVTGKMPAGGSSADNSENVPPWEDSFAPPMPAPPMEFGDANIPFEQDNVPFEQPTAPAASSAVSQTAESNANNVETVIVENQVASNDGDVDKKVYSELLQRIKKGNKSLYTMMNQGFWAGFSQRKLTIGFPGEECEVFMQAVDKRKEEISKYLAEMGFSDIKIYVTMSNVDSKQAAIDLFGKDNITIID